MGVDSKIISVEQFDQLEIIKSGTVNVDYSSVPLNSSSTTSVTHNLGYTPLAIVFLTAPGDTTGLRIPLPYIAFNDTTGLMIWQFSYATLKNTLELYFENHNNTLGPGFVFNYYLLRQRAKLS